MLGWHHFDLTILSIFTVTACSSNCKEKTPLFEQGFQSQRTLGSLTLYQDHVISV